MLNGLLESQGPEAERKSHPLSKIDIIAKAVTSCEKKYSAELKRPDHYARRESSAHARNN